MPLTDFFVASPKELRAADPSKLPASFKELSHEERRCRRAWHLNEILTKSRDMPDLVIAVSEEGPWVLRLPTPLTRALGHHQAVPLPEEVVQEGRGAHGRLDKNRRASHEERRA